MDYDHQPKTEYVYYVAANTAKNTEDVKREVRSAYGGVAEANNQTKAVATLFARIGVLTRRFERRT